MVLLGHHTKLTNAHAVKTNEIIECKIRQGKDSKKVRMSIAEKEHVWRIGKKIIDDEEESEEEMIPKRLYD